MSLTRDFLNIEAMLREKTFSMVSILALILIWFFILIIPIFWILQH